MALVRHQPSLLPMLASLGGAPLEDPELLYELKYDGIRAIAEVPGGAQAGRVRLWSRLGNEKTSEFPDIVAALERWGRRRDWAVVLDGEIVALDARGNPAGFQQLQRRGGRVAFIAFDLLRQGAVDLRGRPLVERRAALEQLFRRTKAGRGAILRISEMVHGDGRALYARALKNGWEGLIAKHANSRYKSGRRTPDWRKLKIVHEQEFVIGGWTEPRQSRSHFGALLLGVYERGRLIYVGHIGTGFDERQLERLIKLMKPLETDRCPFHEPPRANQRPHWTKPALVAEVRFSEWTADGNLRHPVFVALRDDKRAKDVRRERAAPRVAARGVRSSEFSVLGSRSTSRSRSSNLNTNREPRTKNPELLDQLSALEAAHRDGVVDLGDGSHLSVTNLHKVFWPRQKLTKGDLLRYYVQAAPFILPVVADRPLVMKRFPNGINGEPFYQHRAVEPPPGVRVETVDAPGTPGKHDPRPQFVGGDLTTLLYMAQLAAISQDPWFSRVQSLHDADHAALDLDPMPDVPFAQVLDVARWIRDELHALGAIGFPKTSGADGLHVYVPLPPETPYDAGLLFCQIVATVVAQKHPKVATLERSVKARGKRVYIDCLQNILGKTLAAAYSARASDYAGVSTPLTWAEVDEGVDREAFTITSLPARLKSVGDLWKSLRRSKGVDFAKTCGIS